MNNGKFPEYYTGEPNFPATVWKVFSNGWKEELPVHLDKIYHSPDGFAWGYGGSGPHQLAYAILYDYSGGNLDFTIHMYRHLVQDIIKRKNMDETFMLSSKEITAWVNNNDY